MAPKDGRVVAPATRKATEAARFSDIFSEMAAMLLAAAVGALGIRLRHL